MVEGYGNIVRLPDKILDQQTSNESILGGIPRRRRLNKPIEAAKTRSCEFLHSLE